MIPANAITVVPQPTNFQPPYDQPFDPLSQVVLGGTAIGDPAAGRQVQTWQVFYSGGLIQVKPTAGAVAFTLAAADVVTISLAFDNNMGLVLAWQTPTGAKLYYFDTIAGAYTTRVFTGPTSCRVCVDDARDFYTSSSDVIFAYTVGGNLYWRQQRDRYDVERLVGPTLRRLRGLGPSVTNRLQFELW